MFALPNVDSHAGVISPDLVSYERAFPYARSHLMCVFPYTHGSPLSEPGKHVGKFTCECLCVCRCVCVQAGVALWVWVGDAVGGGPDGGAVHRIVKQRWGVGCIPPPSLFLPPTPDCPCLWRRRVSQSLGGVPLSGVPPPPKKSHKLKQCPAPTQPNP